MKMDTDFPNLLEEKMECGQVDKISLYTRVFEKLREGLMITDKRCRILSVNPAFTNITGFEEEEVVGLRPSIIKSGYHSIDFYIQMWTAIHEKGSWQGEILNRRKNGEIYPEWLHISTVSNTQGEVTNYVAIFSDISEQKESEEKLRLYRRVFEHASEGMIITDSKGVILSTNPAFTATTGFTEEEAQGKTPKLLHSNQHDLQFYIEMWASIHERGNWQGEIWNRRKNGEIYPEWLSINAVKDDEGHITNYVGIFSDITERKKSEEHLKFLAHYDILTELPNRFLFHDRLGQSILQAQRLGTMVAVMFLDLDRFKGINDTFGHGFGDYLLQQVAHRLKKCVRKSDTVARLGGDEFTVILPAIKMVKDVAKIAEKLLEALSKPFIIEDQPFYISTSIGISLYPSDGISGESLIKHADAAMYQAKEKGNCYLFYEPAMMERAKGKFMLENGMHTALEKGEFIVYYQPQVDLQTRKMKGLEALIRWQHPVLGLVPPSEFIPIAEETGWIIPIGEWIIYSVCKQGKAWQDAGYPPMKISVNLSPRQLQDKSLVDILRKVLLETGLDPSYLELEITETISIQQMDSIISLIGQIRELGLSVSIDDFGTGYSCLSYLKRYPIDTLKIDRSFVKDIVHDSKNAAIAKGIMEIAHGLDLNVIAEGIETEEEFKFFQNSKCNAVQGYLFSKPVPPDQIERIMIHGL